MGSERRGRAVQGRLEVNPSGEEPTDRPRQKNAGLWEPYDGRLSRTVLREREGEVPSRHSPGSSGQGLVRLVGIAGLIAGAVSMAAGEYLSMAGCVPGLCAGLAADPRLGVLRVVEASVGT